MIEIFISPSSNFGFVWNADDWLKLRQNYRIVGDLIGSLSKYPRQNSFNGLPLCLQPEEVSLLREKGYAKVVGCTSLFERPHDSICTKFEEEEKIFHESQRRQYILKKKIDVERSFEFIVEGKNQKHSNFSSNDSDKKTLINEEVKKIENISASNFLSCTLIGDPWLSDEDKFEPHWSYPNCEKEKLKSDVFKDLWEKQYYITSGSKFGGDFLCYSGDPAKFHAEFIILCVENHEKLSAKDLVTFGRIGSSTKKTFALATKFEGSVLYQSLLWLDNN